MGGLVGGWVGGWVVATGGFQDHKDESEKRGAGTGVVSASSRDPVPATKKKVIIRRKGPAQMLRELFRDRRNLLCKVEKEWKKGRVPAAAYQALKTEVEKLAEMADEASWANGRAFTDSKGIRRLEKQFEEASIVARLIHLYHGQRTT